jgi:hypothetical protein
VILCVHGRRGVSQTRSSTASGGMPQRLDRTQVETAPETMQMRVDLSAKDDNLARERRKGIANNGDPNPISRFTPTSEEKGAAKLPFSLKLIKFGPVHSARGASSAPRTLQSNRERFRYRSCRMESFATHGGVAMRALHAKNAQIFGNNAFIGTMIVRLLQGDKKHRVSFTLTGCLQRV